MENYQSYKIATFSVILLRSWIPGNYGYYETTTRNTLRRRKMNPGDGRTSGRGSGKIIDDAHTLLVQYSSATGALPVHS